MAGCPRAGGIGFDINRTIDGTSHDHTRTLRQGSIQTH